jgi:DNA-binding NarL/FixJ family response regulator
MHLMDAIREELPSTRLLVMTWPDGSDVTVAGADAILDKSASPEDLVAAIAASLRAQA